MLNIIKNVLTEQEWRYIENDGVFKLDVEGENASWSSFLKYEDEDSFSYYGVIPSKVSEDKLSGISELISKLNFQLKIGSFEINLSGAEGAQRGQIMFKTYGIITKSLVDEQPQIAAEIVRKAIAFNMLTMDYYCGRIMKALYSDSINYDDILN